MLPSTARCSAALGLVFLVSACSAGTTPVQQPALGRYGAPPVAVPRDITDVASEPCTRMLTANQRVQLGIDGPGRARTNAVGAAECRWDGGRAGVSLTSYAREDILVASYRNRMYTVFQPIEVGGLPAVAQQTSAGTISCTVTVGTAENQGFDVVFDAFGVSKAQPCDGAVRVADAVVANLPPLRK